MKRLLALLLLACPLMAQSVAFSGNGSVSGNVQVLAAAPSQQSPLVITTANPLTAGDEGVPYSEQLAKTGGTDPVAWTLDSGSLPPGLNLAGGGESLNDPSFALAVDEAWAVTGDFSIAGGAAVYAHSSGSGSVLQGPGFGATGLAVKLLPGATYDLNYEVASVAGNPVCVIPTIPATSNVALDESNGAYSVSFTAHADPHTFAISCTSDTGDDTISFPVTAILQQTGVGTIFGTPTAPGTYPFTVRVTDAQPVFATKSLSIVIDPEAPAGGLIFTSNGDDTGDMSAWVSTVAASVTSTGLVDGNKEITKTASGDEVMVDNIDAPEVFVACDVYRSSTAAPDTSVDSALKIVDSGGTILGRWRIENDWDMFAFTPDQTTFSNRGFFLGTPTALTSIHVQVHYLKGTGANALWEARVNGVNTQSFNLGTSTANVDRVMLSDGNDDAAQDFVFDRCRIRTDTWEVYTPPSPAPPPDPTNCLNGPCVFSFTVPSGSDRLTYCFSHSEGNDRDPSGVALSVDGAMTEVGTGNDQNGVMTTLWVKLGATVGAQDATASFPGGSDEVEAALICDTRAGVASATAEATASNQTASGTSLASTISTASTDPVIVAGITGSLNGTASPTSGGMVEIGDSPGGGTPGMFGAAAYRLASGAPASRSMNFSVTGGPMALTFFAASFPIVAAVPGTLFTSYGGVCDGVTDDSPEIQTALNDKANWTNATLILPAGQTCLANGKHTMNADDWTINGNGATIKAANGLSCNSGTAFFIMTGAERFTINNLTLDGNRANRCVQEHSAGDNFRLLNVKDASFNGIVSKNATNDNLSVRASTPSNEATHSRNLTFSDSKFDNAYRNNVSVIEGHNIRFLGTCSGTFAGTCTCQMTNANGTDPQTGIDWEPNSGSTSEAITDGVVDGCQLSGNARKAYSEVNGQVQNNTLINSIIRGNGHELTIWGFGGLYENNYFTLDETIGRFAWLDFRAHTSIATALNPARVAKFQNNFLDGVPLTGSVSGVARIVAMGNCNPFSVKCGPDGVTAGNGDNSTEFQNNTITNSGISASGDWCNGGPTGNENPGIQGNTLQGTLQSPNPGCP